MIDEELYEEGFNQDWERENDYFDSMQQGKECNGCYCQNCDFFYDCSTRREVYQPE